VQEDSAVDGLPVESAVDGLPVESAVDGLPVESAEAGLFGSAVPELKGFAVGGKALAGLRSNPEAAGR
jgi:hypothetical protein